MSRSNDFEYHYRCFHTALSYGLEMSFRDRDLKQVSGDSIDTKAQGSTVKHLGLLHEEDFFDKLYISQEKAEKTLRSELLAADRLITLSGKPGSGKTSLVRAVLRSLKNSCEIKDIILLDILKSGNKRSDLVNHDPALFVKNLDHIIVKLVKKAYREYKSSTNSMLLDLLDIHSSEDGHLSYDVSVGIDSLVTIYEFEGRDLPVTSDWLNEKIKQKDCEEYKIMRKIKTDLVAEDALKCLYKCHGNCKTLLVFDNLDAVAKEDTAKEVGVWIRSIVNPLLNVANILVVLRTDTMPYFYASAGDRGSIRAISHTYEDLMREEHIGYVDSGENVDYSDQRRKFERNVLEKRLDYLQSWFEGGSSSMPDDVLGLFGAFTALRKVRRILEDAEALSNWNYRSLVASLGNFARVLYLNLDIDWAAIGTDADSSISQEIDVHIESVYYSWLAGVFPRTERNGSFSIREYNPVTWHKKRVSSGDQLKPKGNHLILASIYNAAQMSSRLPIKRASSDLVISRMGELGFNERETLDLFHSACTGKPSHTSGDDGSGQGSWQCFEGQYGKERRYLIQSVYSGNPWDTIGENKGYPDSFMLTDRGRQLIEYVGVKTHYIMGLADRDGQLGDGLEENKYNVDNLPLSEEAFDRFFKMLQRMAGYHIRCVHAASKQLEPLYEESWLDILRNNFCLMQMNGSRYSSGGNFYMDRLLLGVEKYLANIISLKFKNDMPEKNLKKIKELRKEFGDYIEYDLVPRGYEKGNASYQNIHGLPRR